MADVTLTIKADNTDAVQKIKEVQKEEQAMYDNHTRGLTRQKGLIQDIEEEIKRMTDLRRKAFTTEDIEKYNKKLAEAKQDLREYEQLGVKAQDNVRASTEKATSAFGAMITKWIAGISVLKMLKDAYLETTEGQNLWNQAMTAGKVILNSIVTGNIAAAPARIAMAIAAQKEYNKIRVEGYKLDYEAAIAERTYYEEYAKAIDQTLTGSERLKHVEAALTAHNKAIDLRIQHTTEMRDAAIKLMAAEPENEKVLQQYWQLETQLETLEAQRVSSTRRLLSLKSGLTKRDNAEQIKAWDEFWKEWNKIEQDAINEAIKLGDQLTDETNKVLLKNLPSLSALEFQRNEAVKKLQELKDKILRDVGALTPEQEKQFDILAKDIKEAFKEALEKEEKPTEDIFSDFVDRVTGRAKLRPKPVVQEKLTSLWELLGIDPESEKGQEQISALKDVSDKLTNILDENFKHRTELAQRQRELYDTQITQMEQEVETESALYEAGLANNVDAKRKQLEQLKIQRDKALAEEEEAIRREREFEILMQTTNLISAVANILKSFTKLGPVGIALAAGAIGTLYAIFATAKEQATAITKLAEGGSGLDSGLITGKSHTQGGERFLDHVEVEHGEAWGVLNRPATMKYGKVFHEIVSSFNKNQLSTLPQLNNMINVDTKGQNDRLDRMISEQEKLNRALTGTTIEYSGNKKIIKSGNKTRIINLR